MCATATSAGDGLLSIDGGKYEGGGQILRIAVSLAAILKRPVKVYNIRAGRPNPGLSNQHVAGLQLAESLTKGLLSSCQVGTSEITFEPGIISSGEFEADSKTAGGFYPAGGGIVESKFSPVKLHLSPILLSDVGSVTQISGYAFVAGRVPLKVASEMKHEAVRNLRKSFPSCPINIDVFKESDEHCKGNIATFMLVVHTSTNCRLAASGISDPRGPHHSQLVFEACTKLTESIALGACCDENMQDQLIVPMALAKGKSEIRCGPLTLHTKTAIYVTEIMLPVKFEITELENGSAIISCEGIGFCPKTA